MRCELFPRLIVPIAGLGTATVDFLVTLMVFLVVLAHLQDEESRLDRDDPEYERPRRHHEAALQDRAPVRIRL